MWHVSSRGGVATLRTAIHLLLTYIPTTLLNDMNDPGSLVTVRWADAQAHTDRLDLDRFSRVGTAQAGDQQTDVCVTFGRDPAERRECHPAPGEWHLDNSGGPTDKISYDLS